MVPSVHPVKFSPLLRRQGAKNRVVENRSAPAEAGFALCDGVVHGGNFLPDFFHDLISGHAARDRALRRFASLRHVTEADDHSGPEPILHCWPARQRLSLLHTPLRAFHGSPVSEKQVFEHFCHAPFPLRMARELFGAQAAGGAINGRSQLLQAGIQDLILQGTSSRISKESANSL